MSDNQRQRLPARVATTEVMEVELTNPSTDEFHCRLQIRLPDLSEAEFTGQGDRQVDAVIAAVGQLCVSPLLLGHADVRGLDGQGSSGGPIRCVIAVTDRVGEGGRAGAGRAVSERLEMALTLATLRAANHAGLLKREYRANNQKFLRDWARECVEAIAELDLAPR